MIIVKMKCRDGEGGETIEDIELPLGHDFELSPSDSSILVWNDDGEESELIGIFPVIQVVGVVKVR